jgi:A/G-specific adenine glycosylase
MAEMLLLRTRADVVAKHAPRLMDQFPSPKSMADRTLPEVEDALRPLGLRWRAHRLHELATVLVNEHRGQVPLDCHSLMKLPGVGPYVAQATLSALTGQPVVLTDANTVRVAARVAGLRLEGDVRRGKPVQRALRDLMGGEAALSDWLAVVDLAATVCLPRLPKCEACPIHNLCSYGRQCLTEPIGQTLLG